MTGLGGRWSTTGSRCGRRSGSVSSRGVTRTRSRRGWRRRCARSSCGRSGCAGRCWCAAARSGPNRRGPKYRKLFRAPGDSPRQQYRKSLRDTYQKLGRNSFDVDAGRTRQYPISVTWDGFGQAARVRDRPTLSRPRPARHPRHPLRAPPQGSPTAGIGWFQRSSTTRRVR